MLILILTYAYTYTYAYTTYTYTRICFASAIIKLLDKATLIQKSQTQEAFLNIAKY